MNIIFPYILHLEIIRIAQPLQRNIVPFQSSLTIKVLIYNPNMDVISRVSYTLNNQISRFPIHSYLISTFGQSEAITEQ